mmetsp:Transcript_39792/g.60974  ORF Transcript_39792/g.60974 Transcript_39792/m.60974 type:complete len:91 (+) Transcript_39792:317-589(+)
MEKLKEMASIPSFGSIASIMVVNPGTSPSSRELAGQYKQSMSISNEMGPTMHNTSIEEGTQDTTSHQMIKEEQSNLHGQTESYSNTNLQS